MIIVQVAGGLGNQLQQYALYRKFVSMGREARLDVSWFREMEKKDKEVVTTKRKFELGYFDRLVCETCTKEEKEKLIGSEGLSGKLRRRFLASTVHWFHESKMYHPELLDFEDMYLSGYLHVKSITAIFYMICGKRFNFRKAIIRLMSRWHWR